MKKCLNLAKLGLKKTKTNPLVGCVIVHNNRIISEGYHAKFGDAHAEVNAIENITNKAILKESILYVNLEPCCHYGKTPPCVDLIIKYKIKQVIIGTRDPFNKVNGLGINKLKKYTNVITGIMKKECIKLNKKYFINHVLKRPLLILKWAESKDGFINNLEKGGTQISCQESMKLSHKWRSEVDGIFVGTNTVISDNPRLTNRLNTGKSPIRITIDRQNKLKKNNWNIINQDSPTIIIHNDINKEEKNITYLDIKKIVKSQNDLLSLKEIIKKLHKIGLNSILIEGGKKILENLINQNLWDEIRIFKSEQKLHNGISSPTFNQNRFKKIQIGEDTLKTKSNKTVIKKIEQAFLTKGP